MGYQQEIVGDTFYWRAECDVVSNPLGQTDQVYGVWCMVSNGNKKVNYTANRSRVSICIKKFRRRLGAWATL